MKLPSLIALISFSCAVQALPAAHSHPSTVASSPMSFFAKSKEFFARRFVAVESWVPSAKPQVSSGLSPPGKNHRVRAAVAAPAVEVHAPRRDAVEIEQQPYLEPHDENLENQFAKQEVAPTSQENTNTPEQVFSEGFEYGNFEQHHARDSHDEEHDQQVHHESGDAYHEHQEETHMAEEHVEHDNTQHEMHHDRDDQHVDEHTANHDTHQEQEHWEPQYHEDQYSQENMNTPEHVFNEEFAYGDLEHHDARDSHEEEQQHPHHEYQEETHMAEEHVEHDNTQHEMHHDRDDQHVDENAFADQVTHQEQENWDHEYIGYRDQEGHGQEVHDEADDQEFLENRDHTPVEYMQEPQVESLEDQEFIQEWDEWSEYEEAQQSGEGEERISRGLEL
ncbi:hypothetical protein HDU98_008943 [Podochytrium sp. JEL0797]|nr:hypothetical protein HDU98_008943 [Podochytrium sp. JEL0797]